MKIVIAGAGGIGFHLAKLLSFARHDIVIIDTNHDILDYVRGHLDVFTVLGDATSLDTLEESRVSSAELFSAVTTLENDNIVSCILAKKLGAKQTIARINKISNLREEFKKTFRDLGVDKIISPSYLASLEIIRLIKSGKITDNFEFENGKLSLIGITINEESKYIGKTIQEIKWVKGTHYSPIAILRGNETILPRNHIKVTKDDHIYFLINTKEIEDLLSTIGTQGSSKVKKIMILGGNEISIQVAKMLEEEISITIVEKNETVCKRLVNELNNTLIIKGDPSNIELLREEGLLEMDALISLTQDSEINIISCLMATKEGVKRTISLVDNVEYIHISQNIGVDTIINKKLIAANYMFRFVRKGSIEAIASLHGVNAEVIEFVINKESQLTKNNLRTLKFPENALIGGVIRGEENLVPTGDFTLQLNDKVIVLALPEALGKIENLFR
ncbi:MAG: Trk system potassium transporter TrkA [Saprospiraceae bacterium]|nr:Trk system potassium transporter TrkA [Saprospiraceae bacterium]